MLKLLFYELICFTRNVDKPFSADVLYVCSTHKSERDYAK